MPEISFRKDVETLTLTFRQATHEDIPALTSLLEQLGYPCTTEELTRRLNTFCALDGYDVRVACFSDKVIGVIAWSKTLFCCRQNTHSYRSPHCGCSLPWARRRKKLMALVEEQANAYKPVVIDLTSSVRRVGDGSHAFYKNLGYNNEGPIAKVYLRKEWDFVAPGHK